MAEPQDKTSDPLQDDPRPVYQGDWQAATGVQKGAHSEAVRQWKLRQGLTGQRPMAAGSDQPVSRLRPDGHSPAGHAAPGDATTRAVLEGIRDDRKALASDRIRASQALIALDRGDAAAAPVDSDLVQLRAVLETLDPSERLAWLQGERVEHLTASVGAEA